jgi:hypothetical protein
MFVTIQDTTFNLTRISFITINRVDKNVIEVRTCDNCDSYHAFRYADEKAAAKAFKEINRAIEIQQSLYGRN